MITKESRWSGSEWYLPSRSKWVLAALKSTVGHPDMAEFARASKGARTLADLENVVRRRLGKTGLMMFMEFDHGAILRKETGLDSPKIVRLGIGNPLIMKDMAKHVPDTRSYAPVDSSR